MRKEDEKMEIDMRTEIEYIERRRLTMVDEEGIKYWTCEEVGELIRCKDCVSFTFSSLSCPRTDILVYGVCTEKRLNAPCSTDFCPYGKRKENNMSNWKEDYSERFDELRKHRVELSHIKYGRVSKNFKTGNVNALATMQLCIDKYKDTGNTEYLCDAANYIMFEFMFPQVPNAYFKATDSGQSAGSGERKEETK